MKSPEFLIYALLATFIISAVQELRVERLIVVLCFPAIAFFVFIRYLIRRFYYG